MRAYNDYTATVKRWLRNYKNFKTYVENADDDIAAKEKEMYLDTAAGVANYSGDVHGGTPELYKVESLANKHLDGRQEIDDARANVDNIRRTLRKIDRALDTLTDTERRLVVGSYMENMTWDELGREFNYTGKWARMKGAGAIESMAVMLFGYTAMNKRQMGFVFLA